MTEEEARAVDEILGDPRADVALVLKKHGVEGSAEDLARQAHIQLYARLRTSQMDQQRNLLASSTIRELMAMSFIDVTEFAGSSPEQVEQLPEEKRRAVVGIKVHTGKDGQLTYEYKFAKLEAVKEFIKVFGLGPKHPIIKSLLKIGAPPEESQAKATIKIGDQTIVF